MLSVHNTSNLSEVSVQRQIQQQAIEFKCSIAHDISGLASIGVSKESGYVSTQSRQPAVQSLGACFRNIAN